VVEDSRIQVKWDKKIIREMYSLEPVNPRILESFAVVFLIAIVVILFPGSALAFHAELSPKTISPGDVFLIKVTGSSIQPSATFAKRKLHFTSCGEGCSLALGGADLKTKSGVYTVKLKCGKKKRNLTVRIKKTRFPKLMLALPDDKVILVPDDLARAKRENERLQTIFRLASEKRWEGVFVLPVENDISTAFGTKRIMNKKRMSIHKGIDICGVEGDEIKVSNNGKVVLAEELFFGGNTVIIDHGQEIYSIYMHLSAYKVKSGDDVAKGDVIGLVGSSGRSSGPHLHFGIKVMNISVNPLSLIKLQL
jgi:hypothetical protein